MVFGILKGLRGVSDDRLGVRCGRERGCVVLGVKARLQLPYPVSEGGVRERRIVQTLLIADVVELVIVEPAKDRDELELWGQELDGQLKLRLARECQPAFGFLLNVREPIATGEQARHPRPPREARPRQVTAFETSVTCTPGKCVAVANVPQPGKDNTGEHLVHASLEAIQPDLVNQIDAELSELVSHALLAK